MTRTIAGQACLPDWDGFSTSGERGKRNLFGLVATDGFPHRLQVNVADGGVLRLHR